MSDDLQNHVASWATTWGTPGLEDRLTISFSSRMTKSLGRCQPDQSIARLASWLREGNPALLLEVLCHEAAHTAVHELHGRRVRPHGSEWKDLMREAGFAARVHIPFSELPPEVRARNEARLPWEHRCPVCHARRAARQRMHHWRCARCRKSGGTGKLVISKRNGELSPS